MIQTGCLRWDEARRGSQRIFRISLQMCAFICTEIWHHHTSALNDILTKPWCDHYLRKFRKLWLKCCSTVTEHLPIIEEDAASNTTLQRDFPVKKGTSLSMTCSSNVVIFCDLSKDLCPDLAEACDIIIISSSISTIAVAHFSQFLFQIVVLKISKS